MAYFRSQRSRWLVTSFGGDVVGWLNSENEVVKPVTALWLKSRSKLETVNKKQSSAEYARSAAKNASEVVVATSIEGLYGA